MKTKLGACVGLKGRLRVRQKLHKYKMKRLQELPTFYERDDNSRATAGKNEYRTLHKARKQVRYLLDTLKNLHKIIKMKGASYVMPHLVATSRLCIMPKNNRQKYLCMRKTCESKFHGQQIEAIAFIKNG